MLKYSELEPDQLDCIAFIDSGEDALVCADVGTGKTVISLTAADMALQDGRITRWLVLAPLLVATDTWGPEPGEWAHLRHLKQAIACGTEDARIEALESDADIVVINYENLQWLLNRYPRAPGKNTLPFDGLICDEIDKLKEVSSERFKDLRGRIPYLKKRVGLTGTLTPNKLTEVWGSTYIVDGGHSLGRSFYEWRRKYFYPTDYKQHKWAPFPDTRQTIIDSISDLTFRLKATNIPPVIPRPAYSMQLPTEIRKHYKTLEDEFYLILEDTKGNKREVDVANAAVLKGKLQQICAGFSYVDGTSEAVWHSKARFDWYDNLYYGSDEQILVFYHFKEELAELKRRHPDIAHLGSGVSTANKRKHIAAWNAGELPQMALHPASAGHGLNLQKSGAHNIAFLTIPWSGGMFKQVTGRLARRGQIADHVNVWTALFDNTVDHEVYDTVTGKLSDMEEFLDDVEAAA